MCCGQGSLQDRHKGELASALSHATMQYTCVALASCMSLMLVWVQVALGTYLGVHNREGPLLAHLAASLQRGRSCMTVPAGSRGNSTVCLLPCHRWNYCHDDQSCCTADYRLPMSLTTREQLERAGVAVLHQASYVAMLSSDCAASRVPHCSERA